MENAVKIRQIIVDSLGCEAGLVTDAALVKDDLGADSLAVVELMMAIEDAFGISIGEDELAGVSTVGDIISLVASK